MGTVVFTCAQGFGRAASVGFITRGSINDVSYAFTGVFGVFFIVDYGRLW